MLQPRLTALAQRRLLQAIELFPYLLKVVWREPARDAIIIAPEHIMSELSQATLEKVHQLFRPEEHPQVVALLETECGNNLPFLDKLGPEALERFRFAALKLSEGNFEKLRRAVDVAKIDWRDLLVAAGFANDLEAHKKWRIE
jgi:hypothetical protein